MEVIELYRDRKQLIIIKATANRPPLPVPAIETATAKINAFMAGADSVMVLSLSPGLDIEVRALDGVPPDTVLVASTPPAAITNVTGIDRVVPIPSADPNRVASYDEPMQEPAFDPAGMDPASDPLAMPAGLGR